MANDTVRAVFLKLAEVERSQRKIDELLRVVFWLLALGVVAISFEIIILSILISRGFG